MNKNQPNQSARPATDSSSSISRVGPNAQRRLVKPSPPGIKNEPTTPRNNSNLNLIELSRLSSPEAISYQDHYVISEIETSLIPLLVYRNGILSNNIFEIHRSPMIPAYDHLYLYHIPTIMKTPYPLFLYSSVVLFISYGVLNLNWVVDVILPIDRNEHNSLVFPIDLIIYEKDFLKLQSY
jgi:hypothetical protein